VPIADLNGKTLDEVFIGGQLLTNPDFDNGTTDWQKRRTGGTFSATNGILTYITSPTEFLDGPQRSLTVVNGNNYYFVASAKSNNDLIFGVFDTVNTIENFDNTNVFEVKSVLRQSSSNTIVIFIREQDTNTTFNVDYVYAINLTALGITATKEQLDFWYSVWQQNHKLGMRVHRASGNDIPLAVLNNQSLNQVFRDGQLNDGVNFENINDFNLTIYDLSIENGVGIFKSVVSTNFDFISMKRNGSTTQLITAGHKYYARVDYKVVQDFNLTSFNIHLFTTSPQVDFYSDTTKPTNWTSISGIATANTTSSSGRIVFQMIQSSGAVGNEIHLDNYYAINLTSLGITSLTKSQLDYLYQVWQFNQVNALVARQFIQEA
jgi:hypothetical protein